MIHTSDLLLTLHTLGILVTNAEMRRTLKQVKVTASGTLDFSEFLEVVNNTSPFTDTEDFQSILWIFKKINRGMVAVDDLETVLIGLGVNLNNEEIQQALGCTQVRNGKVDILSFLQTAWGLQRGLGEEGFQNECDAIDANPFHDVTELVNADTRWRKKYSDEDFIADARWRKKCSSEDFIADARWRRKCSNQDFIADARWIKKCSNEDFIADADWRKQYCNEEFISGNSLVPVMTLSCSNKDLVFAQPKRRLSWKSDQKSPSTVISTNNAKEGDIKQTKSQLDATDLRTTRSTSLHKVEGGDKDHGAMEVTGATGQTNTIQEEEEQ
ncbi:uncharacterized protein LOC132593095 [Zootoca vivipara]|uniref:uncharacterized protein LOC132593095 n=1 Tax=Zootoca vivipara TaxID=8524 RepID=UPI00293BB6A0|nr:uncharacterized protein LOC132593095 [Zootoca vivipara]